MEISDLKYSASQACVFYNTFQIHFAYHVSHILRWKRFFFSPDETEMEKISHSHISWF